MIIDRLFKIDVDRAESLEAETALASLMADECIVPATMSDIVRVLAAMAEDDPQGMTVRGGFFPMHEGGQ